MVTQCNSPTTTIHPPTAASVLLSVRPSHVCLSARAACSQGECLSPLHQESCVPECAVSERGRVCVLRASPSLPLNEESFRTRKSETTLCEEQKSKSNSNQTGPLLLYQKTFLRKRTSVRMASVDSSRVGPSLPRPKLSLGRSVPLAPVPDPPKFGTICRRRHVTARTIDKRAALGAHI